MLSRASYGYDFRRLLSARLVHQTPFSLEYAFSGFSPADDSVASIHTKLSRKYTKRQIGLLLDANCSNNASDHLASDHLASSEKARYLRRLLIRSQFSGS